jgi:hypothetical protein
VAADGLSFRWSEDDNGATPPGAQPGMTTKGCATIGFTAAVPAGAAGVELLFNGTRDVTCSLQVPNVPGCPRFVQEAALNVTGQGEVRLAYHDPGDPAAGGAWVRLVGPALHGEASLRASWSFSETSSGIDPSSFPLRPTGAAYAADVRHPVLHFTDVPATPALLDLKERRAGSQVFQDVEVGVAVGPGLVGSETGADLRVRFDAAVAFREVRAPDGAVLTDRVTRVAEGPFGFDRSKILLERTSEATEITVPAEILRQHGAGTYVLVESQGLQVQSVAYLLPLAWLLLLAPFPFAAVAVRQARTFERQAFGGFRRSARNLRVALVVALLYYLAVVGAALLAGGVDAMTRWPLSLAGGFLYLQLALAAAAFASLYFVARELHGMTLPREPHPVEGRP